MDDMMWLRMFGGGLGTNVDLTVMLAFVAFGVVSFLAPVVGYRSGRSVGVTTSLFLLVGYVGVSVVQLIVEWLQLFANTRGGRMGPGENGFGILFPFALAKMALFFAAMLSFAIGVGQYRLPAVRQDAGPGNAPDRNRL